MKQQLVTMLTMQDSMNRKVHPQWVEQKFEWYRAVWIECGELIDHYGYKWWKKQNPDMEQVQLEVVDIWHFGMSALFDGRTIEAIADAILSEIPGNATPVPLREAVEALVLSTLTTKSFSAKDFWAVMLASGLTFDELYRQYVGKNVLNFFRQDHGYKEGTYNKVWQGKEDNEHLVELSLTLDILSSTYRDDLYKALKARYLET